MILTYFLIQLFHLLIIMLFALINPFLLLQIVSFFDILVFFILVHFKFPLFKTFIIFMAQGFFLLVPILILALFIICLQGHDLVLILLLINLTFRWNSLIHLVLNLLNYCLFFELLFLNFMEDEVYLLVI